MTVIFFCFSQKQRRAALRKERRKRKRQAVAQARECGMKRAVKVISCFYSCGCTINHSTDSVIGLKNGAGCTPEEEIKDEDDENDDYVEER